MKVLCLIVLTGIALALGNEVKSYNGFQVFRTYPVTDENVNQLKNLEERNEYSFWTGVVKGQGVDIMASPDNVPALKTDLAIRDISFEIMIFNVEKLMELERIPAVNEERYSADHDMTWNDYHSVEDMYSFLEYLEATYDFVSTEVIGQTYEGRNMTVAKVCKGECGGKPAVWIDGGIHAREWISSATVTWMLRELVENESSHPDLTSNMDWYILPSHNPDGYEYSRESDRMWRKTKSEQQSSCMGVDANRNWGFHWNEGGSSNDPCSETYHGPEAWSEVENVNVRDFISARQEKIVFFSSLHSYSQLILLPWGFTYDFPEDYNELLRLAFIGSDAITMTSMKFYKTGTIPGLLYIASGGSIDWAHGEKGIKFATSIELRDTGKFGFLLPPSEIIPTAQETWAFHVAVARELM